MIYDDMVKFKIINGRAKLMQFHKVLVIGLGQLGLPVAKYVMERGFDTYGYDISIKTMEHAKKTIGIKILACPGGGGGGNTPNNNINNNDFGSEDFDVFIICVSTHKPDDMFSPQINGLLSIADKISREAKKDGALVSIESTIPKGTSKKVFEMLNHRLHVAHAPHRWYALEEKEHGVNQLRVIGGVCDCCLRVAMQFYNGNNSIGVEEQDSSPSSLSQSCLLTRRSLGISMHPVSSVETAEITKIAENAHRYLQIAFAEDLYLYCQENSINFVELRNALNTKWNVNILEPREGIGGHCLPKDTLMFIQSSDSTKSKILTAAMEVDQDYRRNYKQFKGSEINEALGQQQKQQQEVEDPIPISTSF
jgi:UDP-N-acetyl-D-mannosaminuronic acid dehydrogenase